jgi:anti-sigma factor RsiW
VTEGTSSGCRSVESLVTPYVDRELTAAEREHVEQHLRVCPPCHRRLAVERATRDLIRSRKPALVAEKASGALHAKCAGLTRRQQVDARPDAGPSARLATWRERLAPLALAATLVFVVAGAFLYQATDRSSKLMAAELTADHVKCFTMNGLLRMHQEPEAVQRAMLSQFGWQMRVPVQLGRVGLELVGSRPCLYGEGKMAHLMYLHEGRPVSIFMLPDATRAQEVVDVLGHQAAIWSVGGRTFVLVAHEPRADVERMASVVQAALQ